MANAATNAQLRTLIQNANSSDIINLTTPAPFAYSITTLAKKSSNTPEQPTPFSGYTIQSSQALTPPAQGASTSAALTREFSNTRIYQQNIDGAYSPGLIKDVEFIYKEQLPSKTKKYIKANGNVYRFIPDIREIRVGGTGRYITTKYFQRDVVQNLHKIAASMVLPQKKSWLGFRDAKYVDQDHDLYAQDLLQAPITEVYGMVVFFCKVYLNWMDNSKDYLEKILMSAKMSQSESEKVVNDLWTLMAGSIKQQLLPNTKE